MSYNFKFEKVHWFYETEYKGRVISVTKQDNGKWVAQLGGMLFTAKTRKQAVIDAIKNRIDWREE